MEHDRPRAAVIGGGPAGLIAAEVLAASGCDVTVWEAMPSFGRKFLMAGRGGLNLTHAEPYPRFVERYAEAAPRLAPMLEAFPPDALRAWAHGLGQETFVGSSERVFPRAMKASPLLRAWLARLDGTGVRLRTRARWVGLEADGTLTFETPQGLVVERPDAVLLALGGASWPRLGSTGAWADILERAGVPVRPFRPSNCGFVTAWSEPFRRFAGAPLKGMALSFGGRTVRGEAMVAAYGLEGGAVYALSAAIREAIERDGRAEVRVDLRPDVEAGALAERLRRSRPGESTSNRLRKAAGLSPSAAGLLREAAAAALPAEPEALAAAIKAVPLTFTAAAPLERAISSAGGLAFEAVDEALMIRALPGVFAAGEMLDWEAPTGGYLLQACLATGVHAARAMARRLGLEPVVPALG